jgi:hypothetical protein
VFATSRGGYTKFIHFLLKAGADPNIPDDVGFLFIFLYLLTWYATYHYILLKLIVLIIWGAIWD